MYMQCSCLVAANLLLLVLLLVLADVNCARDHELPCDMNARTWGQCVLSTSISLSIQAVWGLACPLPAFGSLVLAYSAYN